MGQITKVPDGYKKIHTHLVYAVKHDGRYKACIAADSRLIRVVLDSVYLGVFCLWDSQLVLLISELNNLDTCVAAIGNACLETYIKEKVTIDYDTILIE